MYSALAPASGQPGGEAVPDSARQAAWALSGSTEPPEWPLPGVSAEYTAEPDPSVRERYAALRDATAGWDGT